MEPDTTETKDIFGKTYSEVIAEFKTQDQERAELSKDAREACLADLEKRQKFEREKQENCPHTKPNQQSAVVGQKIGLFGDKHVFICQYCQKEWDKEEDIPPHLRPVLPVGGVSNVTLHGDDAVTNEYMRLQAEEEEYQRTRPVYDIEKDMAWGLWYQRQNWLVRRFLHPKLQYLAKLYNHGKFIVPYQTLWPTFNLRQRIRILFTGRHY